MTAVESRRSLRAAPAAYPGRVRVSRGAISTAVQAVVAERLGVPAKAVDVSLADEKGALALSVSSPLAVGAADTARISWLQESRAAIADSVTAITGASVGSVRLRITGLRVTDQGRVR